MREISLDSLDGPSVVKWVLKSWMGKWNQRDGDVRETHLHTVGFEDGRRGPESEARGCEWPPDAGRWETQSLKKERSPDVSRCCGLSVCVPPPRPQFHTLQPYHGKRGR